MNAILDVFRYRPDQESEPTFQRYEVPFREEWVVLDALNYIKDHLDGTLSYRWSCRMGICGSCGMMVNGDPKLTCSVFLRDYHPQVMRVEPLRGFPVIRDLVIDLDDFMHKMTEVKTWMIPKEAAVDRAGGIPPIARRAGSVPAVQHVHQLYAVLCRLPRLRAAHSEFLGPAAIALAQRYNMDSRDAGYEQRAETLFSDHGVWMCTFVGDCSRVCPKNVDPAAAIQQAKVSATKDFYRSLVPWGKRRAETPDNTQTRWIIMSDVPSHESASSARGDAESRPPVPPSLAVGLVAAAAQLCPVHDPRVHRTCLSAATPCSCWFCCSCRGAFRRPCKAR
jgi:fumarate reductase iron-sulfur subunit